MYQHARSVSSGSSQSQSQLLQHPGDQNHFVNPLLYSFSNVVGPSLPCRYRPRRAIGRGAFSTVWTLVDNTTGQTVVGKLSDLAQMTESNKAFARAEAANIRACSHPNIIRLIETFEQDEKLLHILEYADGGDLLTQVELRARGSAATQPQQPPPPGIFYQEPEVLVILAQLCLAIKYLHDKKIMHRDLKTPNVMVMRCGLLKLGDFGFSRQYEDSVSADVGTTFCGTPYYLAPELWRRQSYSYKADIWSLGVILYELLTLRKPFPATDLNELMTRVLRERSFEPLPEQQYSAELIQLIYNMLSVDPAKRPSIREILATPLMQKGLHLLKVNVKRLKNIDPQVQEQIVSEVEQLQEENKAALAVGKGKS